MKDKLKTAILESVTERIHFHVKDTYFGVEAFLMWGDGTGFVRIYMYKNDNESLYIDNLSVDADFRHRLLATDILENIERICFNIGAKFTYLWCCKDTWMYDWYKRIGYIEHSVHDESYNEVWMRKEIEPL